MADASLTVNINGQDNLSGELKNIESGVIRFVGAVSAALTTLSAIGFPVVSAANFQKELLNAAKTTNYTRDQIGELREGLDALSKQSNISAIDLAKIATLGGQLGIGDAGNVQALLEFTKQIGVAITALDIPAEEAVDSIGKLINIFNVPANEFQNLVSSLNEVSNSSTATATQLFDVVRRIGNLGGSVGLPQAAAISASMIDLGLTAETAGTTITKIFADMKSNASAFANVAVKSIEDVDGTTQIMRYSTEEWVRLVERDGLTALKAYVTGLNQLGTAQQAQVKSQLTGEGRLFEAVTKLQQQQLRQAEIQSALAEAERSLAAVKAQGTNATEDQVRAEEARVEALKAASVQANVLDRLNQKATEAFRSGDSAIREQETTMAGLIAQWQRFANNLTSLVNSVGGTLLGPLTDGLRGLSDQLQQGTAGAQLQKAAQDIVDAFYRIGDAITFIRSYLSGWGGFDWGALLRAGALIAAMAVFKGLVALFRMMGGSALAAIPGLTALQDKLFGVSAAMQKAAVEAEKLNTENARQGGWIQKGTAATTKMIDDYLNLTKSLTDTKAKAARVADGAERGLLRSQTALDASMRALPAYANTVAAAQQRVLDYEQRRDAAMQAGNRRAAAGYQSQINQLNTMLSAIRRNEQAVQSYTNQIALAKGIMAKTDTKIDNITIPFKPKIDGLVTAARTAATEFKTSFGSAIASGSSPLAAFAAAVAATTKTMAASGAKAGAAYGSGFVAGLSAAASGLGSKILSALGLEDIGDRWEKSTTKTAKGITILSGAFGVLSAVVRGLFGLLSRFIGVAFFAMMLKEVLDLLGLWDKLLVKINELAAWAGIPEDKIPDFLKPAQDLDRVVKAADDLGAKMQVARDEAAKFGKEQQANLALLRANNGTAQKDMTFDAKDPGRASQKAQDYFSALLSGYSRVDVAAKAYEATERQLRSAEIAASAAAYDLAEARKKNADLIERIRQAEANLEKMKGIPDTSIKSLEAANKELNRLKGLATLKFGGLERSAEETASKLTALQESAREFRRQMNLTGGDIDNPFEGQTKAAQTLVTSLFNAKEAVALFGSTTAQQASPMQTYVDALLAQRQAAAELAEAEKKVGEQRDTKNRTEASYRDAYAAEEAARQKLEKSTEATDAARVAVEKLGRSRTAMKEFLDTLTNTKDPDAIKRSIEAMANAVKTLPATAFKGLAVPEVKADSLISAASIVAVKTRVKSMYDSWATAANIAAERAKNAATTAMADVQKLARDAQAAIEKINQTYSNNKDKAARQTSDRAADAASRQRMRDIQTQYDMERALLEQMFSAEKNRFAEMEAGGMRVSSQKQQMYAMEQQALFDLDEKYNKLKESEQDRLNISKAKRGVQDELKAFDALIAKIDYYKKRVEEANKTLLDPSSSIDKKAGAIEQRNVALDKMKSLYGQLEAAGERIASTEPIGGQMVVDPAQIDKVNKSLDQVATTIGKVGVEGADKIEPVFRALATNFGNVSAGLSKEIEVASQAFVRMSGTSGKAMDDMVAKYASLVAQNNNYVAGLEKIQSLSQQGLAAPGSIKAPDVAAITDSITKAVAAAGDQAKINLSVDGQALAGNIANALRNAASGTAAAPAPIAVTVAGTSLDAMKAQIEQNVKPKLQGEIEVKSIKGANAQMTVTYPAAARGGFFSDIVAQVQKFAGGGKVSGPGTGTSDSILARLSHGEYVMDALTTSRFGPDFFASLQKAARGGYSLNFLKGVQMPKFATGGYVGADVATAFSGIANDFKSSMGGEGARDMVDINLSSGGQRATIQAERQQAKSLVGILRQFEKGR